MDKEIENAKEATKVDKLITKIKNELFEAKKEIKNLKDEKSACVGQSTSLKNAQLKKDATIKDLKSENQKLKLVAENSLKVGKTASANLIS